MALFEYGPEKETGMVIGEHLIMTPGTIKQMRHVPDIAFLNCCYLGSVQDDEARSDRHRIAANLGTELIRMGVRCVVAAGWEVNDAAAERFAEVFYREMLSGETFGEAVKVARKATHTIAPNSNTWGAYQCYGDPSYRLFNQTSSSSSDQQPYVSPEEFILELNTLISHAQEASERNFEGLQDRLNNTILQMPEAWKGRARVVEVIANACGELELFERAIVYYGLLSSLEQADFKFKALETKANLEARVALDKWIHPDASAKQKKEALKELGYALKFLHFITDTQEQFTTAERCSLVGKAYKCQAVMSADGGRWEALIKSAEYYAKAYKRKSGERPHLYSGFNWLMIEALLDTFYPGKKLPKQGQEKRIESEDAFEQMLADIEKEASEAGSRDPNFWNLSAKGDLALYNYLKELLTSSLDDEDNARCQAEISNAYAKAWKRGGTYKKRSSILQQFSWLISIMEEIKNELSGSKATKAKESAARITEMVSNLKSVKVALQARLSDQ